jgi:hypothetical protein
MDRNHVLYRTADADAPGVICDARGEVVLGLCRRCGAAEAQLVAPCAQIADDSTSYPFLAFARRHGYPYGAVLAAADAMITEQYIGDLRGVPEKLMALCKWESARRAAVQQGVAHREPVPR